MCLDANSTDACQICNAAQQRICPEPSPRSHWVHAQLALAILCVDRMQNGEALISWNIGHVIHGTQGSFPDGRHQLSCLACAMPQQALQIQKYTYASSASEAVQTTSFIQRDESQAAVHAKAAEF